MWRGRLEKLLSTPYNKKNSWKMAVTKVNSIIYVNGLDTDELLDELSTRTEKQERSMYWGFKLEDLLTQPISGKFWFCWKITD